MTRKKYEAPKVVRIKLEMKHSVLAECHSSAAPTTPNQVPYNNCLMDPDCFN